MTGQTEPGKIWRSKGAANGRCKAPTAPVNANAAMPARRPMAIRREDVRRKGRVGAQFMTSPGSRGTRRATKPGAMAGPARRSIRRSVGERPRRRRGVRGGDIGLLAVQRRGQRAELGLRDLARLGGARLD